MNAGQPQSAGLRPWRLGGTIMDSAAGLAACKRCSAKGEGLVHDAEFKSEPHPPDLAADGAEVVCEARIVHKGRPPAGGSRKPPSKDFAKASWLAFGTETCSIFSIGADDAKPGRLGPWRRTLPSATQGREANLDEDHVPETGSGAGKLRANARLSVPVKCRTFFCLRRSFIRPRRTRNG